MVFEQVAASLAAPLPHEHFWTAESAAIPEPTHPLSVNTVLWLCTLIFPLQINNGQQTRRRPDRRPLPD
jgi:hypothetical protein